MFKKGDLVEYLAWAITDEGVLPPGSIGVVTGQLLGDTNYYKVRFWCLPSFELNQWHMNLRLVKGDQNV